MNNKEDQAKQRAITKSRNYMSCKINAAITINSLHRDTMDIDTLTNELLDSFNRIKKDNLLEIQAMLLSQAHTLNVFFNRCLSQVGDMTMVNQIQTFSDLALRAQNNCRKTLATLAELKNPKRATFIKQQNNSVNQQVNNSENPLKKSNEQLCEAQHESLDDRSKEKAIAINTTVGTLETVDRC